MEYDAYRRQGLWITISWMESVVKQIICLLARRASAVRAGAPGWCMRIAVAGVIPCYSSYHHVPTA
jgi:hypothetical protein